MIEWDKERVVEITDSVSPEFVHPCAEPVGDVVEIMMSHSLLVGVQVHYAGTTTPIVSLRVITDTPCIQNDKERLLSMTVEW